MAKRPPKNDGFVATLARDFRRLRLARDLTQLQAALLVGYKNPSNISAFEAGDARPRQPHFDLIAALVDEWRREEVVEALHRAVAPAAHEDGSAAEPHTPETSDLLDALARAYAAGRHDLAAKLRAAVADLDALDKRRRALLEQQAEILAAIAAEGEKAE